MSERVEVDLCIDCVTADANGADAEGVSDEWRGFLPEWDEFLFGEVGCGGTDPDDLYCEGHFVRPGTACHGCGSALGGDRYCFVAVRR